MPEPTWTTLLGFPYTSARIQGRLVQFRIDPDLNGRSGRRWADLQMFSLNEGWVGIANRTYTASWNPTTATWDTSEHTEAVKALQKHLSDLLALGQNAES